MQNREGLRQKNLDESQKNNMSGEGEKYHFQKGGREEILFSDQNIDPWLRRRIKKFVSGCRERDEGTKLFTPKSKPPARESQEVTLEVLKTERRIFLPDLECSRP
jgi:hypothetical protein